MAVFLPGVTNCPICRLTVDNSDEAINFPPLFVNQHHDVFEITDAVVHRACLAQRPYSDLALTKLSRYQERRAQPRVCKICGQVISDPDDYFGTGPLADDPSEAVAHLDWFEAHARCLATWGGRPQLAKDLLHASDNEDWEGDVLQSLASRLNEIGSSPRGSSTT